MDNPRNALSPGYQLHWYTIKKILGQGGFGITYLAEDTNLDQEVAIKEFLPVEMAVRDQSASVHPVSGEYGEQFKWGLDRFMSEAQTLARFKHPNIVRVFTVFPENNTAYMVMEYEHGRGLHELLKNKNTLSEAKLKAIVLPILDGLKKVHAAGFIHRDIKPANIFIREDGSPVLLDFGSARQSFGQQTRTLTTMVSPGFAPFEQYVSKSDKQGPWTDIYGLGATLYRAVIGVSPAEAMDRSEGLLHSERDSFIKASDLKPEGYSSELLAAIDHALAFKPEDRPQSIAAWQSEIEGVAHVDQAGIETVVDPEYASPASVSSNVPATEKTVVLEKPEQSIEKKKPSLFRRLVKYTLIGFAVLFILAILSEEDKKQNKKEPAEEAGTVEQDMNVDEQLGMDNQLEEDKNLIEPEADNRHEQIQSLFTAAGEDIDALRLTKPQGNNAFEKYKEILELDPANADAEAGIESIGTEYLMLTRQNIENKDLDKAEQYLNLAKQVSPDHPDIPEIERILSEDIQAAEEKQKVVDQAKESDLDKPSISSNDKANIKSLQQRLRENPRDREARKELQSIMKSYESKVKAAIEAGDFDTASAYLKDAQQIAPRSVRLKTLLKKVEEKQKQQLQQDYQAGKTFRDFLKNGDEGPEMVIIPVGSFQMGSKRKAREFFTGETPVHKVTFDKPFAMMTTEMSVGEFAAFIEATGYETEAEWQGGCGYWDEDWKMDPERYWNNPGFPQSQNNPVVCISWNDAMTVARWLSKETGYTYRLPTEAEWEYAARAGKKGDTYWGSNTDRKCEYENLMDYNEQEEKTYFQCTDGYTYTSPTGNFSANAYGLHD
ncbi:MAG: SUMF1/EgtB/PvdO family nonheme iron enzyme, partial [Proteobacteria bacterium]|nr:SUMF1/EgtB/PvdO family nonheme iron enzyme [Pseudomonadota bacterium]